MLPYFAGLATWLFPRLTLRPHSEAEAEALPRGPFSLGAFACLMGLSLVTSLLPAALTRGGVFADYWWTRNLYQFRFHADLLALVAAALLYLVGLLLNVHYYSLPTPTQPHRRAAFLLAAVGSATLAVLSADLLALLFFFFLFLLALWLLARLEAPEQGDRMLLLTSLGGVLLLVGALLMWQEAGFTSLAGLPLTLVGSSPSLLRTLGLLVLFGFLPLLFAFPLFHWLLALAREDLSGAMASSALLGLGSFALALRLLPGAISLPLLPSFASWALALGLLTVLWAALGAWGARSLRGLALWLTIAQSGFFLLALSAAGRPTPAAALGLRAAVLLVFAVPLPVLAVWMTASLVSARAGTDSYAGRNGLVRPLPFAAFAFLLGGLSLAGVPPFPGFWALRLLLAGQSTAFVIVLLLLDLLLLLAVLGAFRRVFLRREPRPVLLPYRKWMTLPMVLLTLLLLALSLALAGPLQGWGAEIVRGLVVTPP